MTHSSGFMPDKGSPMSSNPPHPPLPHPTSHMQYQPHHHLPATPLTPSHSSSAEADGTLSDGGPGDHILGGGGSGPGIPQSVKGAPKHLRPVIRKLQNSAVCLPLSFLYFILFLPLFHEILFVYMPRTAGYSFCS